MVDSAWKKLIINKKKCLLEINNHGKMTIYLLLVFL